MKAVILAAGYGTRLSPLTNKLPKVMLPLNNKPLIFYQIQWLKKNGIREIAINLHHLPEKIKDYLDTNDFGVKIIYSYEKSILGTAGGVKKLENFLKEETFIVFYGDNITNINLKQFMDFHKEKKGIVTVCLHKKQEKEKEFGVVVLDKSNQIVNFIEKPNKDEVNKSNLINSGIYIVEPEIFDFVPKEVFSDFGKDIFPKLLSSKKTMFGYIPKEGYWREIGTLEKYELIMREFNKCINL